MEISQSGFKASQGKRSAVTHLTKNAGCGGVYLFFHSHRKDMSRRTAVHSRQKQKTLSEKLLKLKKELEECLLP
jgi:hypothetical protein